MSTLTQPQETINQVKSYFSNPQEAVTHVVGNAALLVQDARIALQQVPSELVEPLARLVGWAEALVFGQLTSDPQIKQQMLADGGKK